MAQKNTPAKREDGKAVIYRMVMDKHICPYGLKSKHLLKKKGYQVEDHHLTTRAQTDAFQKKHNVKTTPQTFIGGKRIGGYDDLRVHFGLDSQDQEKTTYQPVIALFSVAFLLSLAANWMQTGLLAPVPVIEAFIAIAMVLLGLQKLQDVESFSLMFLNYDLLAQKKVGYASFYPFAETAAGVLMLAGVLTWISAPLALFIGTVGAVSVFKAVYIDKRELKCACVGGSSNVPLGFISLTENLMMVAMALWMLAGKLG